MRALAALCLLCAPAAAPAELRIVSQGLYAEPDSSEEIITSRATGRDYRIRIWQPRGVGASGRVWNLYVLDGEVDGGTAAALAQQRGGIRIISIAAATDPALAGDDTNRSSLSDFQYRREGNAVARGEDFQSFLVGELKPQIERRYPGPAGSAIYGYRQAAGFLLGLAAASPQAFGIYAADRPILDDAATTRAVDMLRRHGRVPSGLVLAVNIGDIYAVPEREARIGGEWRSAGGTLHWMINRNRLSFLYGMMDEL